MNAADTIRQRAPHLQPRIAVVLGSGWGGLTDHITDAVQIPYADLQGFPQPSVAGHSATLWLGHIGAQAVAVMSGRKHGYETGAVDGMALPLQVLKTLGCHTLVQTNAAGSLRPDMPPQSLMLITDHLNLPQRSPLVGVAGSERFVNMVGAYDFELNRLAALIAKGLNAILFEGVYAWFLGPQFETPAEIRMARLLGADAVGMSTVPETILARHLGLRVLALSFITNFGAGMSAEHLSHAHTLSQAQEGSAAASRLLANIISSIGHTMTAPNSPLWPLDLPGSAHIALACLDLTSLNDADTEADVAKLCQRAQSPFGPVAAVCVWPRLAAFARAQLPAHIGVAAVANFPHGNADVNAALQDTLQIVQAGAQEVDVVLPYKALIAGDEVAVSKLLTAVRQACPGLLLKVILETGELQTPELIARASQLALDAGADFLKTSTGKTPVNATPEAARLMLSAIAASASTRNHVGFKASGGIRTVQDAVVYEALTQHHLGADALNPKRFRIGASSILSDIEAVLGNTAPVSAVPPGGY